MQQTQKPEDPPGLCYETREIKQWIPGGMTPIYLEVTVDGDLLHSPTLHFPSFPPSDINSSTACFVLFPWSFWAAKRISSSLVVNLLHLFPDAWFSLWSQDVSPMSTPDTKTDLAITEKAGTAERSDGVGKQALWLSKSLRRLCVGISVPTIWEDRAQWELPWFMPGSGEGWLLQNKTPFFLACMSSLLHAPACLARCHHETVTRYICSALALLSIQSQKAIHLFHV